MKAIACDPVAGVCSPAGLEPRSPVVSGDATGLLAVYYVGDPMCSWCWGMSPAVRQISAFCEAEGMAFSVVVGGLRVEPEPWTAQFRAFLRREWELISRVTGQKFGYSLLDLAQFEYLTEPACRAVVVARELPSGRLRDASGLAFFSAIQEKFYVEGCDPKSAGFYRSICEAMDLPFHEFEKKWHSREARQATRAEFDWCQRVGVNGFPHVLLQQGARYTSLARGYASDESVIERIRAHQHAGSHGTS